MAEEVMYTIRPLKWKKEFREYEQAYESGDYRVVRRREDYEPANPWGEWRWEYCFCEYYDEETTECASAAEGKAAAEKHWHERLLPALKPVEPKERE